MRKHCAQLAQLVEQRTENPCVSGSIPELGILIYYGILAQVVEHLTFNQVVRGSNPRCLIKKYRPCFKDDIFLPDLHEAKYGYCMIYNLCGCGGIGRRARFRF